MIRVVSILLLLIAPAGAAHASRKQAPVHPARPAAEAALAFYPEIQARVDFHQRWAATAEDAELDTCRARYRREILSAFADYAVRRRRELAQTRWPQKYAMSCRGKTGTVRSCRRIIAAPLGHAFDTASIRTVGRAFTARPAATPDRRKLDVTVTKKGEGTLRARFIAQTQRTVEDIEREVARELEVIRKKLERHGLPSDATIGRYLP